MVLAARRYREERTSQTETHRIRPGRLVLLFDKTPGVLVLLAIPEHLCPGQRFHVAFVRPPERLDVREGENPHARRRHGGTRGERPTHIGMAMVEPRVPASGANGRRLDCSHLSTIGST